MAPDFLKILCARTSLEMVVQSRPSSAPIALKEAWESSICPMNSLSVNVRCVFFAIVFSSQNRDKTLKWYTKKNKLNSKRDAILDIWKKHAWIGPATARNSWTDVSVLARRRTGDCTMLFSDVKDKPQGGGCLPKVQEDKLRLRIFEQIGAPATLFFCQSKFHSDDFPE